MTQGIKESLELLEGVKVLGVSAKKVLADGKVNLADLPVLLGLISDFPVLTAAVQGADLVLPEVKDLSADEANQLVAKVLEVVNAIKTA